ncbi:antA/AntB antirepressor family protein [Bartonella sp. 220]|uniref:antA/AntB antirepressor family protein n=1 Tax=Bartonella sp. 220B TaxID=2967260 RepID=UPI0022A9A41F|nr:antA/AntB antirepressor family protein [Bartonella sp. 220B]MCZ2159311.1 antA/AntB antirepressor family protein [Bartonella sp. 220B]
MKSLIPTQYYTIKHHKVETVNARDLHAFLEIKSEFSYWIKHRIKRYKFLENIDFVSVPKKLGDYNVGRKSIEYYLTLDMAKHIAICEASPKGKQVRKYFLECEKKAKPQIDYSNPETLEEFLKHLRKQIKHNENACTNME